MSSEPVLIGYVLVPAAVAVMASVTAGAWILVRVLRTRASRWMFVLVVASIAWIPVSLAMRQYLPSALDRIYVDELLPPNTLIWVEATGYALFPVGAAVCSFLVALQVRAARNPNNGVKNGGRFTSKPNRH